MKINIKKAISRKIILLGIVGFLFLFCALITYWVLLHNKGLALFEKRILQIKHVPQSSKVFYNATVNSGPGSGATCCYSVGEIRQIKLSRDKIINFYNFSFKKLSGSQSFYSELLFYDKYGELIDGEGLPMIYQKLPFTHDINFAYYLVYFNAGGGKVGYDIRLWK